MKIVCDSCSAKYSIADEKVAGRVFKIRCKKCGAAIVVRGDQVDAQGHDNEAEAATRVANAYDGDAVWHVVVEGDQQGPFSPAQIGEMLSAGTIGWDAFVWREGFDDWKPAQDIEELVSAVMGGAGGGEAQDAGGADMGADPFAATQHAGSAGGDGGLFGAPQAAVARQNDVGADLFAQTESASPFGAGGDDDDDGVVASAPGPRVSADQALTGARNENSVLFSLSNLQALATGPSGGASSSAPAAMPSASAGPRPGMASGEGSGLIDIRALASATGVTPGSSGPVTSASNDKVDDLLSIGGAGAVGLGSSLGAPVLIPEKKEESNKGLIIGLAAAVAIVAVAAAAIVVVVVMGDDETPAPPVAAAGTVPPGQTVNTATPSPTTTAVAAPGATAQPAAQGAQPAADPAAPAAPEQAAGSAAEPEREHDNGGGGGSHRDRDRPHASSRGGGGGGSSHEASSESHEASRGGGGGGGHGGGGRGGGDIDDLLNQALGDNGGGGSSSGGGGGGRRGGGGGGGSGPPTPSRGDVVSAMNSVQRAVSACGNGQHGMATVRVVFSGSNGRVSSAEAQGSLPPPVRSCIARAVRGAHVPPFQQSTFSINYPFRL